MVKCIKKLTHIIYIRQVIKPLGMETSSSVGPCGSEYWGMRGKMHLIKFPAQANKFSLLPHVQTGTRISFSGRWKSTKAHLQYMELNFHVPNTLNFLLMCGLFCDRLLCRMVGWYHAMLTVCNYLFNTFHIFWSFPSCTTWGHTIPGDERNS
jgi:hypothetical protein